MPSTLFQGFVAASGGFSISLCGTFNRILRIVTNEPTNADVVAFKLSMLKVYGPGTRDCFY